ncbi:hypothetical protein GTW40_04665, partial [Streptomyces sp. SID4985]|nr:hypothetical protein [Streptomyces sp. SID4985]
MGAEAGGAQARRGRRARVWLAAGIVLVGGTGAAAVALRGSSSTDDAAGRGPHVVHTSVDSLGLTGGSDGEQALAARSTKPFRMLAVSWSDTHAQLDGTVQVRTKSSASGQWSDWQRLSAGDALPDPAERDRAGVRGATAPLWTGLSDGVQVRVQGKNGTHALPKGLTVDLVDPGRSGSAASADGTDQAAGAATPALQPAGYSVDGDGEPTDTPVDPDPTSPEPETTAPTDAPTGEASPVDSSTPPPPPSESAPESPVSSPSAPATTSSSPASPTASATTAVRSATPTAPGYLPSVAAAYPSCPG